MDTPFNKVLEYTDKEILLSWSDIDKLVETICQKVRSKLDNHLEKYETIAITNGGIIPATMISDNLGIKNIHLFPIINKKIVRKRIPVLKTTKRYLLIDEIYDTGKTLKKTAKCLRFINHLDIFLIERYDTVISSNHVYGTVLDDSRWVVFPWEGHHHQ
jgi:hypoxanthine phosphoribosyltransferase